jgi:hypothetical protein
MDSRRNDRQGNAIRFAGKHLLKSFAFNWAGGKLKGDFVQNRYPVLDNSCFVS